MLYLLTGAPGSGKTLSAIEWIHRIKRENPDRLIYAANIDGLNIPGVISLDDDGVRSWHEACEKNSIIFVDEAQRYWRAQRSGDPSQAIIEMETHRHDGIDLVMMTQHPTFLHSNIRKLINQHIHLVAYTKNSALRWEWRECKDDVQNDGQRASGEFKEWKYPQECFDSYESATQHTKIIKRPWKQILGRAALVVSGVIALGGGAWAVHAVLTGAKKAKGAFDPVAASDLRASAAGGGGFQSGRPVYRTPKDYLKAQIPRVEAMPWSAPIYDGQQVTAHPRVFCASVQLPGRCYCVSDQGTDYDMSQAVCRKIARHGPAYDPFLVKHVERDKARKASDASSVVSSTRARASVPIPVPGASGDRPRATAAAYVPPTYGKWNPDPFGGK